MNRNLLCILFYCDCMKFSSNCSCSGQRLILRTSESFQPVCVCVCGELEDSLENEAVWFDRLDGRLELSPVCVCVR